MKSKVVFMGSKPIGHCCLSYLIAKKDILSIELIAVFTNDNKTFGDTSLSKLASDVSIPVFRKQDYLKNMDYDFIISVQYHEIIKAEYLSKASKMAVNLHMAPLPEYRGCNQFTFAILDDSKEFGTTLHIMSEGIDSGDIIAERRFEIPSDCFVKDLYDMTYQESCDMFKDEIEKILRGEIKTVSQKDLRTLRTTSIHYRKEIEKVKEIDLAWSEDKIWRHIRATSMPGFAPPYIKIKNTKINLVVDDYIK